MAGPFIGEIRVVAFDFVPPGWARCDGQLLPISQHTALFTLLGTTYGGDGRATFALPDLRGRTPLHTGPGHPMGEATGGTAGASAATGGTAGPRAAARPAAPGYLALTFMLALFGAFPPAELRPRAAGRNAPPALPLDRME
jgi:microcystin-dependent protein